MNKKILILTGSPRVSGNSRLMTDAFRKGAEEAGHDVTVINTADEALDGCRHCDMCWTKGRACAIDDGFTAISEALNEADILVFAAPMYWSQFPSYLKAPVDRFYAYTLPENMKHQHVRKLAMLTCGDGEDTSIFNSADAWCREIADFFSWEYAGYVGVPRLVGAGEVNDTDGLKKAYDFGKNI